MGKIVKFCSECEEGFAEKFGFCPNCGSYLEAFEMNPLQRESVRAETNHKKFVQPETPAFISASEIAGENSVIEEPEIAERADFKNDDELLELDDVRELNVEGDENEVVISEPETEAEVFIPAATAFSSNGNSGNHDYQEFSNADVRDVEDDDDYHITVIEEKNVRERNMLLLGSAALMITLALGGFVYSLFAKSLDLAAIDNEEYLAMISNDVPMPIDEPDKPKPDKKESGGGGGGGREEETETSKGRLATQTRDEPLIRPDKTIVQKDFELKQPVATTVGDKKIKPTDEPYGNPNSTNPFGSNGRGKGGGQGEGEGPGQGNGRGTGAGNGNGSGFGNGDGDGNGNGSGSGNSTAASSKPPEPKEPPPAGPSKALNITYKPKPKYTDEARQNNITGNVRVRVMFTSSGQIGSVSPVSNLGYGLTEQAIAAAKQIKFEPEMKNGRPVSVSKVVVFNFTIY